MGVGEGNFKNRLLKKVKNLNIDDKIIFLGKILKPYDLIAGSDYFILPSRYEGLPNCVLESLALGTPVIAFSEVRPLQDFSENIENKSLILCNDLPKLELEIN